MKTVAVVAYSVTIEYTLTVIRGITDFLEAQGDVNIIVVPLRVMHSSDYGYDYQYWTSLELLRSDSVDAVIVVTNSFLNKISVEQLAEGLKVLLPKPVISVSTPLNLPFNKYSCVSCNNAYVQIVEHLITKHNRKKIAFFSAGLTQSLESLERVDAYKAALTKFGMEIDESLIFDGDFTPKTSYEYVINHYKSRSDIPYDAILCANDYMAAGCIGAFQEIGVSIPEDICVVGFDDTEVALFCSPTISTINQQIKKTGSTAAEIAYRVLNGEEVDDKNVVDTYPVYRQSCGCIAKNLKVHGYYNQEGEFVDTTDLTTTLGMFSNGINDMEQISNHLNMMDTISNIPGFFENVKNTLKMLSIPLFSICVYDNPIEMDANEDFELPETANLTIQIDNEHGIYENYFEKGGIPFDVKKSLLPDNVQIPSSGLFFISPIFQKEKVYGYFLSKISHHNYPFFFVFFKILTNAFINSYEFSKGERERVALVEKNQNLNFEAKTDELTKLFNRRGFQEYGEQLIDLSVTSEKNGSVFFCDLDGLKTINDTWGHETGDLAIKTEAKVLRAAFRDSDLVGRLSGDEFGVIAPGFPPEKINVLRERFLILNKQFSEEAKLPFTLSISVGAVGFNSENQDLKQLLTQADKKLYEEKKIKHPEREYKDK